MFKSKIWEKFIEFSFLKFQIMNNFTNKHVILGYSHVTSSQRAHKGKHYTKNNQSISTNLINITP